MADTITIAGHVFNVPDRYQDGYELNANEAAALNQTFHENLRNNFAKKVEDKKANGAPIDDDDVLAALQADLDKYAEEYEFGVRSGAGGVRDPVLSEAMRIAKDKIREHLKRKGIKLKDVEAPKITEAARKLIEKNPEIMELAKARVQEAQMAAAESLDDVVAGVTA
jgi:hypothetical protein